LARAKQRSAKAWDSVDRQRALILEVEKDRSDTSVAEDVLNTLIETQHLCEDAERCLIHELRSIAPEEWRLKYAEELKAPPANIGNRLLNSLPFTDLALIQPFLERIGLSFRSRLQMANRTMKTIHFPESGMISVVAVSGGGRHQTPIGLIGREGMTGVSLASARSAPHSTWRSKLKARASALQQRSSLTSWVKAPQSALPWLIISKPSGSNSRIPLPRMRTAPSSKD